MSSTYGEHLKLSIFGQSHAPAIGMTLDGIPAGLPVDLEALQAFLNRRAPGQNDYSTPRKEEDRPEFLSGVLNGFTCGAPLAAIIRNTNTRSGDYANLKDCPRPGHADYTAQVKYGGYQDTAGGGHFSGRLTAPLTAIGGICLELLERRGVTVGAHAFAVADVQDAPVDSEQLTPAQLMEVRGRELPVFDEAAGARMREAILAAKADGDSVGGVLELFALGLPGGLGDPMFAGVENRLAAALFGIPAVRGVEFGDGFSAARLRGSAHNDAYCQKGGRIGTKTNHHGGVIGGITTGEPLVVRMAVKPTPSIAMAQRTLDMATGEETVLSIQGRHDPCIALRAVPVMEAVAAIVLLDLMQHQQRETNGR